MPVTPKTTYMTVLFNNRTVAVLNGCVKEVTHKLQNVRKMVKVMH